MNLPPLATTVLTVTLVLTLSVAGLVGIMAGDSSEQDHYYDGKTLELLNNTVSSFNIVLTSHQRLQLKLESLWLLPFNLTVTQSVLTETGSSEQETQLGIMNQVVSVFDTQKERNWNHSYRLSKVAEKRLTVLEFELDFVFFKQNITGETSDFGTINAVLITMQQSGTLPSGSFFLGAAFLVATIGTLLIVVYGLVRGGLYWHGRMRKSKQPSLFLRKSALLWTITPLPMPSCAMIGGVSAPLLVLNMFRVLEGPSQLFSSPEPYILSRLFSSADLNSLFILVMLGLTMGLPWIAIRKSLMLRNILSLPVSQFHLLMTYFAKIIGLLWVTELVSATVCTWTFFTLLGLGFNFPLWLTLVSTLWISTLFLVLPTGMLSYWKGAESIGLMTLFLLLSIGVQELFLQIVGVKETFSTLVPLVLSVMLGLEIGWESGTFLFSVALFYLTITQINWRRAEV